MAWTGRDRGAIDVDAVVVGAGFGGMYMMHRLRELGMSFLVFEAAPEVGGTWYWNSYPGARCDIPSLAYNYSFDPELRLDYRYRWPEMLAAQSDILAYAQHVADRYDLRCNIRFNERVIASCWDESARCWQVTTENGDTARASFLISAAGSLSAGRVPDIPGLNDFGGEWHHTARWPKDPVELNGKRIVVIGTGSSGVQIAPVIAPIAEHLTVLQRTAQYCVPARNMTMTRELADRMAEKFSSSPGLGGTTRPFWEGHSDKYTFDDTPEQREAHYENMWQTLSPLLFVAYRDTMTDPAANHEVAEFVRRKIRAVVQNPETAEKLMPTYAFGTKRQVVESGYYDMFNRANVSLEDVQADPIERIVHNGIALASGKLVEADVIVFATGFDALTGPITQLNIEGVQGLRLEEAWSEGPQTFLGLATHRFPNLFFLTGPGSPSVLGNVIEHIEQQVEWLRDFLAHLREHGINRVEVEAESQQAWVETCNNLASKTLYPQTDSWYVGANIEGKPRAFLVHLAGRTLYQATLDEVSTSGYRGFCGLPTDIGITIE